jgi:alpha-glucosidase
VKKLLRISSQEKNFNLYYKDHLFFSHSLDKPCFEVGIGSAKYKQFHARFRIKDYLEVRIPLIEFEILSILYNQIIIEFSNGEESLVVEFMEIEERLLIALKTENESLNRLWIKLKSDKEEAIFGCGEQFSKLNLRGHSIPIWVENASPESRKDHTYYPQPNFISSNNYYCHVQTSFYSEFNFENEAYHELYIWDIPKEIHIGKHESMLQVVENLNKLLGLQPKLAEWAYEGIWLGIQGGPEIVNKKIEKARKHGIKVAAVWCQDWQGIRFTSFGKQLFWNWKYDESIYPNLPEYIKSLNSEGIRFLGYINTMLAMEGDFYKVASEKGYCIKNEKGGDYYSMMTDFPAPQLDFTNSESIEWLKSIIKKHIIGIGLNGWMVDYGEYAPVDAVYYSGISGEEFHNQNPTIFTKLNYDVLEEENLLDEVIFFARSGFTGTSKYSLMQFSGDQRVDWDEEVGLPSVIPAAINIGFCGIGYFHFDIGCYTTYAQFKRDKELFMRSAENAVFSMLMRTHEGNRPDVNWQFDSDDETLHHLARMVNIHVHLMPYLKDLSQQYQETGIPPIRGCFLHYENDPILKHLKFQYLFGRDLLVAPVIKPNQSHWKVYLPRDDWVHVWTGKSYSGGWITVDAPIGKPPVFYRKETEYLELFKSIINI